MLIIIIMLQHFNFIIGFATGDFCYNSLDMQWKYHVLQIVSCTILIVVQESITNTAMNFIIRQSIAIIELGQLIDPLGIITINNII